ncbi:dTDP-4-dehydrorhamnose reductase [Devosia marina]|uniref:dTDP-4-dehydrorhamnose reductase n=1 Tax=Devosia marina TaxID=2683198 RepID=A0A7X3K289_9HYPH|nr:dTDP-4-dehydrorhamnose reductase [Devosia marina]MVS97911.1 dTDP-4-dehydrorhamnose reductase [Devosia marina]
MATKLLVIGQDGQVARAMAFVGSADNIVTCVGRPELDLTDPASVRAAIDRHKPDIVINPAAYTAVDKAESEVELAYAINRDGAAGVAAAAAEAGLPIVHISTDYVFGGDKAEPYLESDPTGPTGVYGASKLAGEHAVAAVNPAHVVLRTAWVYAPWGHNFARTMLRLAADRDVVRVVVDQQGTPTYAPDIAQAVLAVCRTIVASPDGKDWRGVFHLTNEGATTWAGFASEVFAQSAARGGPSARVEPITTADYPTPARRPANSRLDTGRFTRTFGHRMSDWRDAVKRFSSAPKA